MTAGGAASVRGAEFADATWTELAEGPGGGPRFDPATLDGLPDPARRWLTRALPEGVPLSPVVELDMAGEIRLGRWLPFTATQILRAGVGFVWKPLVGGRIVRFVGADLLGADDARMEFRLHGLLPVVRASGPDVRLSAAGRLAAETVAWLPQALTPQRGARWAAIDDQRATVTLDAAGEDIEVEVSVDDEGRLGSLGLQRWNGSAKPPAFAPFGGSVEAVHRTPDGVELVGRGAVGWDWHTPGQADGVFFRYEVTAARFG